MSSTAQQTDTRIAQQLLTLLPRLGQVWSGAVRECGVGSIAGIKVLGLISRSGPTRPGELAAAFGSTPSAMSELIEGLVGDGLARRDPDPTDRRAQLVALTPAGQAEVDRVVGSATANLLRLVERLAPAERTRLGAALSDLERALGAQTQKETRNVR
jgi:DNA-binding MarR family transcriptional regulator